MPTLERTCKVGISVDQAQERWNEFAASQAQAGASSTGGQAAGEGNGQNPGTVYFNEAGEGQTEVTMQLNSDGIAEGDESTLNQRVDGFLKKFKEFAESR